MPLIPGTLWSSSNSVNRRCDDTGFPQQVRQLRFSHFEISTREKISTCFRTHLKLHYLSALIALGHTIALAMTCWFYLRFDFGNLKQHDASFVAFGLVPNFMNKSQAAFYAIMALSELNAVAILVCGLVEDLRESFDFALSHRVTSTIGLCVLLALPSIFFTTPAGGRTAFAICVSLANSSILGMGLSAVSFNFSPDFPYYRFIFENRL